VEGENEVVTGNSSAVASELIIWGAAGLGVASLLLAGLATYLIVRHQGYFYRAQVRSTHRSGDEHEDVAP
jgi:hypothetical protein